MTISSQEIEIERLKSTVVALNTKASVVDDHVIDVENHYGNHKDSENQRGVLHGHLVKTKEEVLEDNVRHIDHQSQLEQQIAQLH